MDSVWAGGLIALIAGSLLSVFQLKLVLWVHQSLSNFTGNYSCVFSGIRDGRKQKHTKINHNIKTAAKKCSAALTHPATL